MALIAIFAISGVSILTLLAAKGLERKRKKPLFILSIISRGDIRIREWYHQSVRTYSEGKEKIGLLATKQLPMRSKNLLNKLLAFIRERRAEYIDQMRDARLLKKSGGISEFFKNMSDVEKGTGEINDIMEDDSQDEQKELK